MFLVIQPHISTKITIMVETTKRFSKDLKIRRNNHTIEILLEDNQPACNFNYDLDKENALSIFKFEDPVEVMSKDLDLFFIFNELITTLLLLCLSHSIRTIIFDSLPLNAEDFSDIFKKFKNTYEENIRITEIRTDLEEIVQHVRIEIQYQKNTHFIQQAYLRNFSSNFIIWGLKNQKKKARIFVFNKHKMSEEVIGNTPIELKYGQKISSIAKEDFFYSIVMEQFIRKTYEQAAPPIFIKLIKDRTTKWLTDEEKRNIVDYIILTWQRSKDARKLLKEVWEKTYKIFAEDYKGKKIPSNIKIEANPEFLRWTQEEMLLRFLHPKSEDYKMISSRLLNLDWRIIKTSHPYFFLSSDNPVVFFNSYYEGEKRQGKDYLSEEIIKFREHLKLGDGKGIIEMKSNLGRAPMNKGIEIYLPISPHICLCIYDRVYSNKPLIPTKINREIILQADENIFSHQKKFEFVIKILSKHPEYINRDGYRQEIKASFTSILKEKEKSIDF